MSETLQIALIGLLGTVLGYVLSLWRSRIVPWTSLLKVGESRKQGEVVSIPDALRQASQASWFMPGVHGEEDSLETVFDCLQCAELWQAMNADSEKILADSIKRLRQAQSSRDTEEAVIDALRHAGISDLICLALTRQVIKASYDPNKPTVLPFHVRREKKDSESSIFVVELKASSLEFGSDVIGSPSRKARLEPFMESVCRLDKDNLLSVLAQVEPLLTEQRRIHEITKAEAEKIVEAQSRWMVHFTVSNVGSGPFAIFPEPVQLLISGGHIRPFRINCRLLIRGEAGDEDKWLPADGVQVIPSGVTLRLAAVTANYEREIDGGRHLRDAYKSGNAIARLKVSFMGKDIPWRQSVKSTPLTFKETDE